MSLFACALLFLATPVQEREHSRRVEPALTTVHTLVVGHVLDPEGLPVGGAVVEASSGGQVFSAPDGSFELAIEVPLEAEAVELSASVDSVATGKNAGKYRSAVRRVQPGRGPITVAGSLVVAPTFRPRWLPTFGTGNGAPGIFNALAVFDDGSGAKLFAAISVIDSINGGLLAWDGSRWTIVPGTSGTFYALQVFDDGSGPALYGGGTDGVARWDGTSWSSIGSGGLGLVRALAVFDDGGGPALYAGGDSGVHVAKWDGSSWSPLGSGLANLGNDAFAWALASHDDGSGPALYVGGRFDSAGGVYAPRVARWNGTSWSGLDVGLGSPSDTVYTLLSHDDGSGPALYAGGGFTSFSGTGPNNLARWDGASWSAVGTGVTGGVQVLATFDDGSGPALYAGGDFFTSAGGVAANRIARWDGSSWTALGNGITGALTGTGTLLRSAAVFDDGSGPALFLGGAFSVADGVPASCIARYDGSTWASLGDGLSDRVQALAVLDEGSGPVLCAAGRFSIAGGVAANLVARWNGSSWAPLGSGLSRRPLDAEVHALAAFEDGSGATLFAGGEFSESGGVTTYRIARWNGSSWSALGGGANNSVHALASFDAGGGPKLYAGGDFTTVSGGSAKHIARWNAPGWAALGSGTNDTVLALAAFDDGGGPALYVGGEFTTAGGVSAKRIARWNGSSWSALGSGVNAPVLALQVFDDGHGPALYVGGRFTRAGNRPANGIARWDGSSWSALGSGVVGGGQTAVRALAVFDDGDGAALHAGGTFLVAGGVAARNLARWDGSRWEALGGGVNDWVQALASFRGGGAPALIVGGRFLSSPADDSYLARWGRDRWVRNAVR